MRWREAEENWGGLYDRPLRVIAVNAEEEWSRDVSEAIATKVRDVAEHEDIELTSGTLDFIEMRPGAGDATYAPFVVIDRLDQPVKIEGALRRQPPMPRSPSARPRSNLSI